MVVVEALGRRLVQLSLLISLSIYSLRLEPHEGRDH